MNRRDAIVVLSTLTAAGLTGCGLPAEGVAPTTTTQSHLLTAFQDECGLWSAHIFPCAQFESRQELEALIRSSQGTLFL